MGSLPKSVKMAASLLSLTIFVLFYQESLAQNPCQDMTVADCTLRPDNIIGTFPFPVAEICQSSCVTADTCMFWRFFKNDTVTECLHLRILSLNLAKLPALQPARRGRCPLRDMEFTILSLMASLTSVCSTPPSRLTAA